MLNISQIFVNFVNIKLVPHTFVGLLTLQKKTA